MMEVHMEYALFQRSNGEQITAWFEDINSVRQKKSFHTRIWSERQRLCKETKDRYLKKTDFSKEFYIVERRVTYEIVGETV